MKDVLLGAIAVQPVMLLALALGYDGSAWQYWALGATAIWAVCIGGVKGTRPAVREHRGW